ncbi:hypothetical protein DI383_02270 [Flavobacteriaceae bacterium LYZ1037]|nr:hypothetical protein DI383_02270 [Flavobacteriaceae bacterium LYZ1037]
MKIHYPKITYNKAERAHLFPLLKPFIKKGEFNDEERISTYAISEQDISFVDKLEDADIGILPMSWNYYVTKKKQKEALDFIDLANGLDKKVWVIMLGDMGLVIPDLKNIVLFRASGYRSKLPITHQGLPIFITDPLKAYYNTTNPIPHAYSEKPKVGFCGLATNDKWFAAKTLSKIALKNMVCFLKINPQTPEQLIAAPYFRYQCLKPLMAHQGIDDKVILREQYRAGAITKAQREQSTLEFYNNIQESDYILCARGAGNFSVRLYETLAMGRIPIYINTDGLLPLADKIDWKKHLVWIEKHEISMIAEKVIAFHQNLNHKQLNSMFISNRLLWENNLQTGTFFKKI